MSVEINPSPLTAEGLHAAETSRGPTLFETPPATPTPQPETPPAVAPVPEPTPEPEPAPTPGTELTAEQLAQLAGGIEQLNQILSKAQQDQLRAERSAQDANDPLIQIINDPEATPRERMLAQAMYQQRDQVQQSMASQQEWAAQQADQQIAGEVNDFNAKFSATPSEVRGWRDAWDAAVRRDPAVANLTFTEFVGRTVGYDQMFARSKSRPSASPAQAAPAVNGRVPGSVIATPAQGGGPKPVSPATAGEDFDRVTDRLLKEQYGIQR